MPDAILAALARVPAPRSFLGLLVLGFAAVAAPLAGALVYSVWTSDRLIEQSRNAVFDAAQAARASRSLVNRAGTLERLSRELAERRDPELLADHARARRSFAAVAQELERLPLPAEQREVLRRALAGEQALAGMIAAGGEGGQADARRFAQAAGQLVDNTSEMLAISYIAADREVDRLRASAESLHQRFAVLLALTAAAALGAALLLARMIARPIGELDRAIRQLGGGELARAIRIGGPRDLRLLGDRLDWLRRRLQALEAQRTRFLRHLSHELKTPLAALREGTELLADQVPGPLAPAQRQVVDIMRDNGARLQRLIESLLDLQRAAHAAQSLAMQPLRLDDLAREAAEPHRLAAQAKGQRLVLELAPAPLEGDPVRLRVVIDNLIGNAVKFAPRGGAVTVLLRCTGAGVLLDVLDSGPGVPPEEREAVFESFFRGRSAGVTGAGGSGLGLAIAREYAEAHGGRIAVVEGGRGGHFRVTLPRRPAGALAMAA